ncbi:lipoprotein insertase outer membrane protein LolB [Rhodoferax sp.]|uniref:lipoprotein insertase outer membrane protein LolB n=1 Tax=Rhodoferax sp. TaxID=50421 RepID=UPI00275B73D6|nr:lipoprotein insertase outer membrane protein LolB [Rhodoferax sp.]
MHRRGAVLLAALSAVLLSAGCAQPSRLTAHDGQSTKSWHGRLAMRVESNPVQSFSAGLELSGDAQVGELILSSPLGTTLLAVSWRPGQATLQRDGQSRQFESMSALMQEALGADLPMTALFAWLAGDNAVVAGWQADLSQLGSGRLSARRSEPGPVAELRLMLER